MGSWTVVDRRDEPVQLVDWSSLDAGVDVSTVEAFNDEDVQKFVRWMQDPSVDRPLWDGAADICVGWWLESPNHDVRLGLVFILTAPNAASPVFVVAWPEPDYAGGWGSYMEALDELSESNLLVQRVQELAASLGAEDLVDVLIEIEPTLDDKTTSLGKKLMLFNALAERLDRYEVTHG